MFSGKGFQTSKGDNNNGQTALMKLNAFCVTEETVNWVKRIGN